MHTRAGTARPVVALGCHHAASHGNRCRCSAGRWTPESGGALAREIAVDECRRFCGSVLSLDCSSAGSDPGRACRCLCVVEESPTNAARNTAAVCVASEASARRRIPRSDDARRSSAATRRASLRRRSAVVACCLRIARCCRLHVRDDTYVRDDGTRGSIIPRSEPARRRNPRVGCGSTLCFVQGDCSLPEDGPEAGV